MSDNDDCHVIELSKTEITSNLACLAELRQRIADDVITAQCPGNPALDPSFLIAARLSHKLWVAMSPGFGLTVASFMNYDSGKRPRGYPAYGR